MLGRNLRSVRAAVLHACIALLHAHGEVASLHDANMAVQRQYGACIGCAPLSAAC